MINWNIATRGPRLTPFSSADSDNSWMIVTESRLNDNGKSGEVTSLCPPAWIGLDEISTWSMVPSFSPRKVAIALTFNKLMLAVNGLESVKEVEAVPVWIMSSGNVSEALLMSVWCSAGIFTGDNRICESADFNESIGVESILPAMAVSTSMPCKKFCNKLRPAVTAPPLGA